MKITLLTVGKTDIKWVSEGLEVYASRLRHYLPFEMKEIPELKNVSALSREQIKQTEGKLILKNIKDSDRSYCWTNVEKNIAPWSSPHSWKSVWL